MKVFGVMAIILGVFIALHPNTPGDFAAGVTIGCIGLCMARFG
jgi:hypothetical protein